jgi:pyruvate kinase
MSLIGALVEAGATAFRLNTSHMSTAEVGSALQAVRAKAPDLPVVVDLQGAKMRFGQFPGRTVAPNERLRFVLQASSVGELALPHPELFAGVRSGDTLSADDGRLTFRVLQVGVDSMEALALRSGLLQPRKGVNLVEHPVELNDLTPADLEVVRLASAEHNVSFAYSFMKDGREVGWIKHHAPERAVIGKIERQEAVQELEAIAGRADALWICRGDLGAQLGVAALARFVAELDPGKVTCPVLMAGQVLEHLTRHPEPTRSEVCHLYDLWSRGYAGIVLSDETAIGEDPKRAVAHAAALAQGFKVA